MKKICFISPKGYPLFNKDITSTFGGAEVQMYMLATEIAKEEDWEVSFIVADYGQEEKELLEGVTVWKSMNFKTNKLIQILNFFRVFHKINADVYVQRSLTVESGLISLYCKLKKKKFIYMVAHDSETDGTHRLYRSKIKGILANLVFKHADTIFVQNQYELKSLESKAERKKTYVLKKGLDLEKISKASFTKDYDAIWVGRSERWKRPEIFLKLAQKKRNRKFLMICTKATNDEAFFYKMRERARKFDNITFVEFAMQDVVYQYLSKSKVFILTSKQEGDWPMVVLEAAASKLPILSYDLNYDDLIDKYKGGILCKGNFNLMNNHFRKLVENQNRREKTGKNAYKYIMDNHNIETNAQKFLKIITNEKQ